MVASIFVGTPSVSLPLSALRDAAMPVLRRTMRLLDGRTMPVMGLGVFTIPEGQSTYDSVRNALRLGYRLIDTAVFNGNEADVGRAIRESGVPRADIWVTTKLWEAKGYGAALDEGRNSNNRIDAGYVDLMLLHAPWTDRVEMYHAMEELQREGVARSIGVSNFAVGQLEGLLSEVKSRPVVNQIELNPFLQRREVVSFCEKAGIALQAYSPLAKGTVLGDPRLVAVAKEVGATPAQVLLRWGIDKGFAVVTKSVHVARQEENAALDAVALGPQQMEVLEGLEEHLVTIWDPLTWP